MDHTTFTVQIILQYHSYFYNTVQTIVCFHSDSYHNKIMYTPTFTPILPHTLKYKPSLPTMMTPTYSTHHLLYHPDFYLYIILYTTSFTTLLNQSFYLVRKLDFWSYLRQNGKNPQMALKFRWILTICYCN